MIYSGESHLTPDLVTGEHWTGSPKKSIDQIGKTVQENVRKLYFQPSGQFLDIFQTFFRHSSDILSAFPFLGCPAICPVTTLTPVLYKYDDAAPIYTTMLLQKYGKYEQTLTPPFIGFCSPFANPLQVKPRLLWVGFPICLVHSDLSFIWSFVKLSRFCRDFTDFS